MLLKSHVPLSLLTLLLLLIAGCGGYDNAMTASTGEYEKNEVSFATDNVRAAIEESPVEAEVAGNEQSMADLPVAGMQRKIVYTTSVGLVVDAYKDFEAALPKLVASHGGFIASSDTDRRYRDSQSGTWVVRVPVDKYTDFLGGVSGLGFAESRNENAQDVTEEYVDLEARIANKKKLESRILMMLDERTGKLSEVLEIERELARVREEIERMEGRIRFLKNRTSLATITITCREEKEYTPPEPPTLLSRISLSWFDSLTSLRRTGEHVLIGAISIAPWAVALAIPLLIVRRIFKQRKASRQ